MPSSFQELIFRYETNITNNITSKTSNKSGGYKNKKSMKKNNKIYIMKRNSQII